MNAQNRQKRAGRILSDYQKGFRIKDLAAKYSISCPQVYRIINWYGRHSLHKIKAARNSSSRMARKFSIAVELRHAGLKWSTIALSLNYASVNSCVGSMRRFARLKGYPDPAEWKNWDTWETDIK